MTDKHAVLGLTALAVIATSSLAWAQTRSPAETVQYRQSQLKNLGLSFKAINDEARAAAPNVETMKTNVGKVEKIVAEFHTWWPEGTGPGAGINTKAKAEIWTNRAAFDERVKALQTAVGELSKASASGDAAAIGAAARTAGQACGACHQQFRERPAQPPAPPPAG
jgi:cytochrome c556